MEEADWAFLVCLLPPSLPPFLPPSFLYYYLSIYLGSISPYRPSLYGTCYLVLIISFNYRKTYRKIKTMSLKPLSPWFFSTPTTFCLSYLEADYICHILIICYYNHL